MERICRLVVRIAAWVDVNNHHRSRISSKRVLQKVRELGISVGHMLGLSVQGFHDIAKRSKTLVDVTGLLQLLTDNLTPSHTLTSSQIDEIEIASLHGLTPNTANYLHIQNHMRPRTVLVHVGACCGTILIAASKDGHDILEAGDILFDQSWDLDQSILSAPNVQMRLSFTCGHRRCQKIINLIVVDLKHTHLDIEDERTISHIAIFGWITILSVGCRLLGSHMKQIEDLFYGSVGDTVLIALLYAIHSVGFSGSCLAVGKDAAVETVDHTECKRLNVLEHSSLRTFGAPNLVEGVRLPRFGSGIKATNFGLAESLDRAL